MCTSRERYPTLAELAPYFQEAAGQPKPRLFAPFPPSVNDDFPFAGFLNAYSTKMRLVPDDTIGPIEHPHSPKDADKVPIYIDFPMHLPTQDTPWIMSELTPAKATLTLDTVVFVPLLGQGRVISIIDLTKTSGTLIISPDAHPTDFVYIVAPRKRLTIPWLTNNPETDAKPAMHVWPRLRKALSSQFDKLCERTARSKTPV
ncbi:hypothetical protein OH77DRAFT_1420670, partial [Trametes cingulata]